MLALGACSEPDAPVGSEPPRATPAGAAPAAVVLPARVDIAVPARPLVDLQQVEDASESVANALVELADKLRRRDFEAAKPWLSPEFCGHSLMGMTAREPELLPASVRKMAYDVTSARVVGRDDFLAGAADLLGGWQRVEWVTPKVKAAEFESGTPSWGRVRQQWSFYGTAEDGGPCSVVMWAWTNVEHVAGRWRISRLALESLERTSRARAIFTDVANAVGLARAGIRFGRPGNKSFAWNGAAAGDVNADGAWDLYVPARPANQLYVSASAGGFEDQAAARGVALPAGGTGALFFDFDNDLDSDLAVADVGGRDGDELIGNPLRLYVNDGQGRYAEQGAELGFDALAHAYSLCAFDADLDGWLDVYVCNYGRVEVEPNDSWFQATNGTPDLFLRNNAGQGFLEESAARGLVDTSWSYAAAAADFDEDGDPDLYVANDYGTNFLYRNDGRGHFEDVAAQLGVEDLGNGMGASWGDLDSDGRLDLYVANMSSTAGKRILERMPERDERWKDLSKLAAGNTIFLRRDEGFERLPSARGGIGASWAWAPALFDIDLDGMLDIYCCSGYVTGDTAADT